MFRTYRHAELPGNALFGAEIQRWSYIEHGLHRPWFYVTVIEHHEDTTLRNMLMLPDEQVLESLTEQQSESSYIESVLLVSPAYMNNNKNNSWTMEKLIEVRLISSIKTKQYSYAYRIDGGKQYMDNNSAELKEEKYRTEKTIYSADQK
jgi:hypothetical protein